MADFSAKVNFRDLSWSHFWSALPHDLWLIDRLCMQPLQHFTSHLGISIIWKEWLWRKNVMANPEQDYWFWGMNRPTSRSVCRPVGVVPSTGELVAEAGEGGYGEAQHEETTLHLGVGSVAPLFRRDTWKKVGKSSVSSECTGNRDGKKRWTLGCVNSTRNHAT